MTPERLTEIVGFIKATKDCSTITRDQAAVFVSHFLVATEEVIEETEHEIRRLWAARDKIHQLVALQAEDEGLWFISRTAPEAYLQQELGRLHRAIEEQA